MTLLFFRFPGSALIVAYASPGDPGELSQRLAALRYWPSATKGSLKAQDRRCAQTQVRPRFPLCG